MKKFTKMALLLLLIVASVFVFTACGDEPDVIAGGEIFVKDSGMPQLVFVQGEELDLSNGVLSVQRCSVRQGRRCREGNPHERCQHHCNRLRQDQVG